MDFTVLVMITARGKLKWMPCKTVGFLGWDGEIFFFDVITLYQKGRHLAVR